MAHRRSGVIVPWLSVVSAMRQLLSGFGFAIRLLFGSNMRYLAVALALLIAACVPVMLAVFVIPIGVGSDELSHIDNSYYRFAYPERLIDVERGLYMPGKAPICQGHQAPLSYAVNAYILGLVHSPLENIASFVDRAAGVKYSSEGDLLGGTTRCNYREGLHPDMLGAKRTPEGSEELRYKVAIRLLRVFNCVLLVISSFLVFLAARFVFPRNHLLALSALLLYASFPSALWRSVFVTNDNMPAFFGALVVLCTTGYLVVCSQVSQAKELGDNVLYRRRLFFSYVLIFFGALFVGLAIMSKYSALSLLPALWLAILMSPLMFRHRLFGGVLSAGVVVAVIAPTLWSNYVATGELFSLRLLEHVVPALYHPSSFSDILLSGRFLKTLLERIWIEFHDIAYLSPSFPTWTIYCWWLLLGGSCVGLLSGLIERVGGWLGEGACRSSGHGGGDSHRHTGVFTELQLRLVVVYFGFVLLSLLAVIHFATRFPLAAGRYTHPALGALVLLLILGLYGLAHRVVEFGLLVGMAWGGRFRGDAGVEDRCCYTASRIVQLVCLAHFFLGIGLTWSFNFIKYNNCASEVAHNVDGGVVAGAVDLDGDRRDELYYFHRIRNRVFFAASQSFDFATKGFSGTDLSFDDLSNAVGGNGNVGGSYGWSMRPEFTRSMGLVADVPLALDVDSDGKEEIVFYRPSTATLYVYDARQITAFDANLSKFSDLAVTVDEAKVVLPTMGDVDISHIYSHPIKGQPYLFFYSPNTHEWMRIKVQRNRDGNLKVKEPRHFFVSAPYDVPILTVFKHDVYLGGYNSRTGDVHFASVRDSMTDGAKNSVKGGTRRGAIGQMPRMLHWSIGQGRRVVTLDVDGDGTRELLSWDETGQKPDALGLLFVLSELNESEEVWQDGSMQGVSTNAETLQYSVKTLQLDRVRFGRHSQVVILQDGGHDVVATVDSLSGITGMLYFEKEQIETGLVAADMKSRGDYFEVLLKEVILNPGWK